MRLSRREFAWGLAGISLAGGGAIEKGFFERRVYGPGSVLPSVEMLRRNGIRPAFMQRTSNGTMYLIPFDSLESRVRAWDRFNGDPDWCTLRESGNVAVKEIRLRPQPGGKILAMSL